MSKDMEQLLIPDTSSVTREITAEQLAHLGISAILAWDLNLAEKIVEEAAWRSHDIGVLREAPADESLYRAIGDGIVGRFVERVHEGSLEAK